MKDYLDIMKHAIGFVRRCDLMENILFYVGWEVVIKVIRAHLFVQWILCQYNILARWKPLLIVQINGLFVQGVPYFVMIKVYVMK